MKQNKNLNNMLKKEQLPVDLKLIPNMDDFDTDRFLELMKNTGMLYIKEETNMNNCLSYTLNFWKKHPQYKIWYNSDHCINIPDYVVNPFPNKEFLPIEEFGFNYFYRWFEQGLINPEELKLLESYFIKDFRNNI